MMLVGNEIIVPYSVLHVESVRSSIDIVPENESFVLTRAIFDMHHGSQTKHFHLPFPLTLYSALLEHEPEPNTNQMNYTCQHI